MPVKHDLYKDLNLTREQVAERSQVDARLNQLLDGYRRLDAEVVEAEAGAAGNISDDELRKLKEKRVLIKDEIVQRLAQKA